MNLGRLGLSGGIDRATTGRKLVGGDMLLSSANRIGKRACRVRKGKRRGELLAGGEGGGGALPTATKKGKKERQ